MHRNRVGTIAIAASLILMLSSCAAATPEPSAQTGTASNTPESEAPSTPTPSAGAPDSSAAEPATARWEATGGMTAGRPFSHVHALPDGRVLVIGEDQTTQLWDPQSGEWRPGPALNNPRTGFASVLLRDSRVLVAGGLNDMGQSYSSAYLFDPDTESWEKAPGLMVTARTNPSAAVLPDGRVLLAGGYFHVDPATGRRGEGTILAAYTMGEGEATGPGSADVIPGPFGVAMATAEIFDPATGEWSSTGSMRYARNGARMAALSDGRVLVVGTTDMAHTGVEVPPGATTSTEIYDPGTGSFALSGELPELDVSAPRAAGVDLNGPTNVGGQLVPLADGGAAIIAEIADFKHVGLATRSLHFDATTGTWRQITDPFFLVSDPSSGATFRSPGATAFWPAVAQLQDGRVLVAGGEVDGAPLVSAQLYDPATDSWERLPDMPEARSQGQAVTLPDGSILVAGGVALIDDSLTPLGSAVRLVFD